MSSISAVALAAVLSSFATVAEAADTTIHTGEHVTSTQTIPLNGTLFVEEGASVATSGRAIYTPGGSGTVTLDNSGSISSLTTRAVETPDGDSAAHPLTFIINNRETGIISNPAESGADVMRPSRDDVIVQINNWGKIVSLSDGVHADADGDAIDFQDHDGAGQSVHNYATGVIDGGKHGITGELPVTVVNEGFIRGRNGSGINIDGGGVIVTNSGTIIGDYRGSGDGDGDAIDTDGDLTLYNSGIIRGLGAGGFKDGEPNYAEGLAIGGGTITNDVGGEIYGKGNGILADNSGGGATNIVTKIYNKGLIEAGDFDAIRLVGNNNDVIENWGTIRAGQQGVAIDMGGGNDTLTLFTGSKVEGLIDGGSGQDALHLDGTGADTLHGNIVNFDTLHVDAGRWTLEGDHTYGVVAVWQNGTLIVDSASANLSTGPSGLIELHGRLEASGSIIKTTSVGGTLAVAGDRIGSLSIENALTLTSDFVYSNGGELLSVRSDTLEFNVDAQGHSDLLTVTNAAKNAKLSAYKGVSEGFAYGPKIKVQAAAGDYAEETKYHIIHVDGTIEGTGFQDSVITNFAFLDASLTHETDHSLGYETNDFFLSLVRNDTQFWEVAETANQSSVAHAIAAAGGSDLHSKIITMGVGEAQSAFNSLSGESYASSMSTQIVQAGLVNDTIQGHAGSAFGSVGGSAQPTAFAPPQYLGAREEKREQQPAMRGAAAQSAGWAKGFGQWLSMDGDGNAAGIDSTVGGVVAGYDAVSRDGVFGFAAGYVQASADVDSRLSSVDTDTFVVAAYGAVRIDRNLKLSGGASYGWSWADSERRALGDKLTASYEGDTGSVFGELAYLQRFGRAALEPFVGVSYIDVKQDGFAETGGVGALTSDGQSFDSVSSTVGLRVAYDAIGTDGTRITPRASLAWRHAYGDVTPDAALRFADTGTGFAVSGVPIAEDSLVVGAGFELGLARGVSIGFDYSGAFAEDSTSNAGKAVGRVEF